MIRGRLSLPCARPFDGPSFAGEEEEKAGMLHFQEVVRHESGSEPLSKRGGEKIC